MVDVGKNGGRNLYIMIPSQNAVDQEAFNVIKWLMLAKMGEESHIY
jgi:hypothetical protein